LEVLKSENMVQNAEKMGQLLRSELAKLNSPHIKLIRGKGLLNAIVINHSDPEVSLELCIHLRDLGLLAKPTHGDKIRFAPPLIINEAQILESVSIIGTALNRLSV
jgi:ornithine--oxo-acid transaminase